MRAMVLERRGKPMTLQDVAKPRAGSGQLLLKVAACGICRTDLHVVDGELTEPKLPLIPGHQIVGYVERVGAGVKNFQAGQRVGVPWLGGSCGRCRFCAAGKENLCDQAVYTGYHIDGGFAEYTVADARYCFPLPAAYDDIQVAPLLCAGLIGYRAYRMAGDAQTLGLYGFGAAAHVLVQVALYDGRNVFAFTRRGDAVGQQFARQLGAHWAGDSSQTPPEPLQGAIIFAPLGELVPQALAAVEKGGKVICAGIHMSDIPSFPYARLWGERSIQSVANLTRRDGEEFLPVAARIPIRTVVHRYALEDTNQALDDLRHGRFTGAAVIEP